MATMNGNRVIGAGLSRLLDQMTDNDVEHLRDAIYASLAQECDFLVQHAQMARSGDAGSGEDARAAACSVRRLSDLLDQVGWF